MQFICFLTKFFISFVLNSSGDQSSREKLKKVKINKQKMVRETNCIMGTMKVADCIFSAQSPLLLPWNWEKKQATLAVSELS